MMNTLIKCMILYFILVPPTGWFDIGEIVGSYMYLPMFSKVFFCQMMQFFFNNVTIS